MATVDIKNPEINSVQRFHNNSQMNNLVHSSFAKREKKAKGGKKKRLTKADIGTPSNFQWVSTGLFVSGHEPWPFGIFGVTCLSWTPSFVVNRFSTIFNVILQNINLFESTRWHCSSTEIFKSQLLSFTPLQRLVLPHYCCTVSFQNIINW